MQILIRRLSCLKLVGLGVLSLCAGCRSNSPEVAPAKIPRVAMATPAAATAVAPVTTTGLTTTGQSPTDQPSPVAVCSMVAPLETTDPELSHPDLDRTLDALEATAMQSHPAVLEARQRVAAARGDLIQAGLPPNPVFQYQSEEIGNDDASGLHSIRLSQQYVTANKLGLARQVEAQTVARLGAELRRVELQVKTRLRIAFARALIAQRRAELTNQIVELAEESERSANLLYNAMEVSKVVLLQARVEVEQARIAAENAETLRLARRQAVAAAAGIDELPEGNLVGRIDDGMTDQPWESLLESITAESPELMAAGSELERARWALRLACAQVTPNVTGSVGAGVDAVTDDTYAVIGVSVPLPIRNRNQGNIRAARAEVAANSAAIERTRLSLASRLADAVGRYETARQRYERLRASVLPSAEETYELSRAAFEAEESSYLPLLTSQRTLVTTRLQILDALGQAKEASAEIEGMLVTLP